MAQFSVNPSRFDPYKNFKFRVKWDGRYVAGVSKVGALKRTTEVVKHREGGDPSSSRKSPGRTEFEAITLERGVTHDTEFEKWANKVWNFGSGLGAEVSLKDFRKDIIIDVYNEAGQLAIATRFFAPGSRNSRPSPISTPMPMPSPSSTSSWRTKAGSAITTSRSRANRVLLSRRSGAESRSLRSFGMSPMEQPMQSLSAESARPLGGGQASASPRSRPHPARGCDPGEKRDALADLSIGERDARLLQLRALLFGSRGEGFAECPQCGEQIEFPLDTAGFVQSKKLPYAGAQRHGNLWKWPSIRFRLPNSRDLAEVVAAPDATQGLRRLIGRCVSPPTEDLPDEALEAISARHAGGRSGGRDPTRLSCPACGHRMGAAFRYRGISLDGNLRSGAPVVARNRRARPCLWLDRARDSQSPGIAPANLPGDPCGMTHFLARLVERARGTAPHVEPLIAPRFASDPPMEITTEVEWPAAPGAIRPARPPGTTSLPANRGRSSGKMGRSRLGRRAGK